MPTILFHLDVHILISYRYLATELCKGALSDYVNKTFQGPKFEGEWEIFI